MLTAVGVLVPVARDTLARRFVVEAGQVELTGYLVLFMCAVAASVGTGLGPRALGLGVDRLPLRLGGGVLLGLLLGLPFARHGVEPQLVLGGVPVAIGVAVIEELLFRGVLIALARRAWSDRVALLLSSVAFGLAHAALYPPLVLLVGVAAGLVLGTWRLWLNDLIAPVVGHAAADAVIAAALVF